MIADFSTAGTLRVTDALAALASLVSSLELLHQRHLFLPGGDSHTPLSAPRHPLLRRAVRGLKQVLRGQAVIVLHAARALAAAAVLLEAATSGTVLPALLLLTGLSFLLHLRDPERSDGADRFLLVLLSVCILPALFPAGHVPALALFFIAGQAGIVYGSSGLLKLRHASWRDGTAILHVLSGSREGNRILYQRMKAHPRLAVLAGYAVGLEALLSLAPLLPPFPCCIVLSGGILLHLAIARIMGFNIFLLVFPASYPAMLFVSCTLYQHPPIMLHPA